MKAINRLHKYIDYKGYKPTRFEKDLGLSNGYLNTQLKRSADLGESIFNKILDYCLDINPEWLLSGKEPMLKTAPHIGMPTSKPNEGIPLIPISAIAGAFTMDSTILEYECERFVIPTFKGADFLISVKGSSMYPKYSSGDIVACKRLPIDTFFQWNKVYVLDTDQGPLIKRMQKGSSDKDVLIVSDNKDYPPFELDRAKIYNIALVLGVIRLE